MLKDQAGVIEPGDGRSTPDVDNAVFAAKGQSDGVPRESGA